MRELKFTIDEVNAAINGCNHDKAIGPDGFDGRILNLDLRVKDKIAQQILQILNSGSLPSYLNSGRIIPIS